MSFFTNMIRGFNEDRWWKYYKKATEGCGLTKLVYTALYMKIASRQGGYVGRETVFHGKPHFPHGLHGVHISRLAEIGENVTIYQGVTIGQADKGAPIIGDNVLCGANSTIIGAIKIGDFVKIGGGTVVAESIPPKATVVSQKVRIILKGE